MCLIIEWLFENGLDKKFEEMDKETLAPALRKFYPSVRQKNKDGSDTGKPYTKQSLVNIRSALNRHLQYPPNNKPWDLMHDAEFM